MTKQLFLMRKGEYFSLGTNQTDNNICKHRRELWQSVLFSYNNMRQQRCNLLFLNHIYNCSNPQCVTETVDESSSTWEKKQLLNNDQRF